MKRQSPGAFTLLELLVAMAVGLLILVMLIQILTAASNQWQRSRESAEAFQNARRAFDAITRTLAQASLNTGYDYYNSARKSRQELARGTNGEAELKAFQPDVYGRISDLHFVSGKSLISDQHTHALFFQAPLDFDNPMEDTATDGQLNSLGYYIRFGNDPQAPPETEQRERFRLMQYYQPTRNLDVYRSATGTDWFAADLNASPAKNTHLLAENIVLIVFLPMNATGQVVAPEYEYDSRKAWPAGQPQPAQTHQLPSIIRVLMVAIDEKTASRNPGMGSDFDGLFQDPAEFEADLNEVETALVAAGANYQVFQTDVPVRASKWSE